MAVTTSYLRGKQYIPKGRRGPRGRSVIGTETNQSGILSTDVSGTFTWVYPVPFPAGVVPVVTVTPIAGAVITNPVVILAGLPNNTQATFTSINGTTNAVVGPIEFTVTVVEPVISYTVFNPVTSTYMPYDPGGGGGGGDGGDA
jgi:hypothetical protein